MYLKQTIKSYTRQVYAEQGEQVNVISYNGLVAIVEDCKSNRFPCLVEMLSENEVVVLVEEDIIESEPVINDQLRLF